MIPYTPPEHKREAFNCPHCNAYAKQEWEEFYTEPSTGRGGFEAFADLEFAQCYHCKEYTLWHLGMMIYPERAGVRPPNPDLADYIKDDYKEAAGIVNRSPRGAAALLRLCVQKLCMQLGEKGKNINDDVANLVTKGLPTKVQQSLDIVRVIGNDAVHPGHIDLKDNLQTAMRLFELINLVADMMISQPNEIDKLYASLPDTSRDAIEKRDKGSSAGQG